MDAALPAQNLLPQVVDFRGERRDGANSGYDNATLHLAGCRTRDLRNENNRKMTNSQMTNDEHPAFVIRAWTFVIKPARRVIQTGD
jgi:hypothetical protein